MSSRSATSASTGTTSRNGVASLHEYRLDGVWLDIAVVGLATRLPGDLNTPDQTWQALLEGRDAITDLPRQRAKHESAEQHHLHAPGAEGQVATGQHLGERRRRDRSRSCRSRAHVVDERTEPGEVVARGHTREHGLDGVVVEQLAS